MIGLAGNDTYIVNDEADQVVEQANEGIDTVRVFGWYVLPAYVNNLVVGGTQDGGGQGNNLGNRMIGNGGHNTLDGRAGNDILTGGGGFDIFRFTTALNGSTNVDRVTDFTVGGDSFWLSYRAFPALFRCSIFYPYLDAGMLHIGASATTDWHRIVYNPSTGGLFYDSDGSGPTPAVRFARLSPGLALTYLDFFLVGPLGFPC
jgi:Ca2+-binding RTX toxin-like protein